MAASSKPLLRPHVVRPAPAARTAAPGWTAAATLSPPALAGIPREGDDNLKRPQQDLGNVPNQAGYRDGMHALRHYLLPARSERKYRHSREGNAMHRRREGWITLAAVVLAVAGIMRISDATWAFRYHGVLPGNLQAAIFGYSLKTYGWVYLAVAAVLILCAFLVLSGSQVGRRVGIVAGAIGRINAIWRMVFYPIWSLTYIAIGVLVIYALAAYRGKAEAV
jgi:hypothetical protein